MRTPTAVREQELDVAATRSIKRKPNSSSDESIQRLRLLISDLISVVESLVQERSHSADEQELLGSRDSVDFYQEVTRFEVALIKNALQRTGGHQRRAALLLNLNSTTLNAKIRQYNIRPFI